MVLEEDEYKNLTTDHVTYTLGPEEEVRVVREIYSLFLDQNMSRHRIGRLLNERGVRYGKFGPWSSKQVHLILTHPKYTGCAVFNRTSQKFKAKAVCNPREQWVLRPGAFPAIVSQDVFDRAQSKLENSTIRRSNERLLAELRTYIDTHGRPLPRPAHVGDMASPSTYAHRFGGWLAAYEQIQYRASRYTLATLESRRRVVVLRSDVMAQLRKGFVNARMRFTEEKWTFRVRGRGYFTVVTARSRTILKGRVRWTVTKRWLCPSHSLIVMRLQPGNETVRDFVLYRKLAKTSWGFTLSDDLPDNTTTIHQSVSEVIDAIAAKLSTERRAG